MVDNDCMLSFISRLKRGIMMNGEKAFYRVVLYAFG